MLAPMERHSPFYIRRLPFSFFPSRLLQQLTAPGGFHLKALRSSHPEVYAPRQSWRHLWMLDDSIRRLIEQ